MNVGTLLLFFPLLGQGIPVTGGRIVAGFAFLSGAKGAFGTARGQFLSSEFERGVKAGTSFTDGATAGHAFIPGAKAGYGRSS